MMDTVSSAGTSLKSQMLKNLGGHDMAGIAKAAAALLNDGSCVRLTTEHVRTYVTVTPPTSVVPELEEPAGTAGGPASRNADLEKMLLFLQLDTDQRMTRLAQARLENQKGMMHRRHDDMSKQISDNIAKIEKAMRIRKALSIFGWIVDVIMLAVTVVSGGAALQAKAATKAAQAAIEGAVEKAVGEVVAKMSEKAVEKAAEKVAAEAVETAVKGAIETVVTEAAENAAKDFTSKAVQDVVKKSVEDAVDAAVKDAVVAAIDRVGEEAAVEAVQKVAMETIKGSIKGLVETQLKAALQHLRTRFAQAAVALVCQSVFTALDISGLQEKITKGFGEFLRKMGKNKTSSDTTEIIAGVLLALLQMGCMIGFTAFAGKVGRSFEKSVVKDFQRKLGKELTSEALDQFVKVGKEMLHNEAVGAKYKHLLRLMTSSSTAVTSMLFVGTGIATAAEGGLNMWAGFADRDAQISKVKTTELDAGLKLVAQLLEETTEELEQLIQKVEASLGKMASIISSAYETEVEIAHQMGQMA